MIRDESETGGGLFEEFNPPSPPEAACASSADWRLR
jgi:hypothetical protein